jgi:hypothetical protein
MKIQPPIDEFDGHAYRMLSGMLHINPSMLQKAKEEFVCQEPKKMQECMSAKNMCGG